MTDAYLTAEQVASILGLSTYTVRAYARKGILPAYKVGNSWRFSRASLKEWVESDRKHSAREPFIVRDAVSQSTELRRSSWQTTGSAPKSEAKDPLGFAAQNRRSIEILQAIREGGTKGNVQQIVRESRAELLERGHRHDRGARLIASTCRDLESLAPFHLFTHFLDSFFRYRFSFRGDRAFALSPLKLDSTLLTRVTSRFQDS